MGQRLFPVNPDLQHLQREAEELLDKLRGNDANALDDFAAHRPACSSTDVETTDATLEDARHVRARTYGISSWSRMAQACQMIAAIRADDVSGVERLIADHAFLSDEGARGVPGNWEPPMFGRSLRCASRCDSLKTSRCTNSGTRTRCNTRRRSTSHAG